MTSLRDMVNIDTLTVHFIEEIGSKDKGMGKDP